MLLGCMIIGVTISIGEATAVIQEGGAMKMAAPEVLAVYPHVARGKAAMKAAMTVGYNQILGWVILVQGKS